MESKEPDNEETDFFELSQDLVQPAEIKTAGTSVVDFDRLLSTPLKLHENLANGCGGQLWPAGMVLAKYILRCHRNTLKDKTMFANISKRRE
jgi:protein N-lysine methyltransferase METTL21A